MKWFNKIQYIILYGLGFAIIGVTSFISGGIEIGTFKDPIYYIENFLSYIAIICVIIATVLMVEDNFQKKNPDYLDCDNYISNFAKGKTFIPSIFSRFCESLNSKRKRKQFEHNVKKQLFRLEKHAKDKDFIVWNHGTLEEKNNNYYCKRRMILEEKLSKEWMDKNLPFLLVHYDKITSSLVLGGVFSDKDNASPNDFITKDKSTKLIKDKIATLLLSFGVSSFASALILDISFTTTGMLNVMVKCMVLIWHTFTTIRYANDWTQQVTLKDIRFRKGIVMEYEKWLTQEAAKTLEQDKEDIINRSQKEVEEHDR